ncbi:MAG: ribosome small subunit-dependent GTPase A [Clostridia bacterium]
MTGLILKGIGSFYTLLGKDGAQWVCKACGRFRKDGVVPMPGDTAKFDVDGDGKGYITDILQRKNSLVRPMVANVDKLLIVFSASAPEPDFILIDKLLLQCELLNVIPLLIQNKQDELAMDAKDEMEQYQRAGYICIHASAATHQGIDELKMHIAGNVCCFAGQSAVGKSSLLNAMLPELGLPVGGLSKKTEHGKHTTRHAELWPAYGGWVLDTPGFSLLDMTELQPHELSASYPEMRELRCACRFPECMHISEPDCAVKLALQNGEISQDRYDRYLLLVNELKEMRKHKYD